MFKPEDDVLEAWAVLVVVVEPVVTGVEVRVLVCSVVRAVDGEFELVAAWLLGHNALMPKPFWKTPIMDVSPTSTPAQDDFTAAPILARPCKQPELQVAPVLKSEDTQASILVLYTVLHCVGRSSIRGVKLEREISPPVAAARPTNSMPYMAALSERLYIVR
jgi:hypothetical protein